MNPISFWTIDGPGMALGAFTFLQLTLWDTHSEKEQRLLEALDDLQHKFGKPAVRRNKVK